MPQALAPISFLGLCAQISLLDLRAPHKYARGHIAGAASLPLFTDLEWSQLTRLHRKRADQEAQHLGLSIIRRKLPWLLQRIQAIAPHKRVAIYCDNGTLCSQPLARILEANGFKTYTLAGGYKAFRQFAGSLFQQQYRLQVLGGYTGSLKTEMLLNLRRQGYQVIDLEGLAGHRGSVFGDLGKGKQPKQQQFENRLVRVLAHCNPDDPIWVEDEGRCIGSACIPQAFFDQMQAAPLYFVAVPKRDRIANLLRQYGAFPPAALIERLGKIQRRLGSHVYHKIVADIQEGAYDQAAAKVLWYYDKAYAGQLAARAPGKVYFLRPGQSSPEQKLTRLNTRASAPAVPPGPPSVDLAKL